MSPSDTNSVALRTPSQRSKSAQQSTGTYKIHYQSISNLCIILDLGFRAKTPHYISAMNIVLSQPKRVLSYCFPSTITKQGHENLPPSSALTGCMYQCAWARGLGKSRYLHVVLRMVRHIWLRRGGAGFPRCLNADQHRSKSPLVGLVLQPAAVEAFDVCPAGAKTGYAPDWLSTELHVRFAFNVVSFIS